MLINKFYVPAYIFHYYFDPANNTCFKSAHNLFSYRFPTFALFSEYLSQVLLFPREVSLLMPYSKYMYKLYLSGTI